VWFIRSIIPQDRVRFVRNHLRRGARFSSSSSRAADDDSVDESAKQAALRSDNTVRRFTETYLRHDGVFLLRLIAHNTNGITTTEITRELWDLWYDVHHQQIQQQQQPAHLKGIEANEFMPFNDDRTTD